MDEVKALLKSKRRLFKESIIVVQKRFSDHGITIREKVSIALGQKVSF